MSILLIGLMVLHGIALVMLCIALKVLIDCMVIWRDQNR